MKTEISLLFKVLKPHAINHTIFLLIFALMEKAFSSFFLIVLLLLHYVMASPGRTQTNITTDQLALRSLKSQIISDPFHFLDESWSPATSVCHWVGVTCGSRHQRVKSLNISNMALVGRIPREFGNLRFLVSLDLGSNNFHGNLPQEMARLHWLKFLRLSVNNFRGKVPSWFGFLHQLQFLSLRNNSFTGSIPSSFSNMSILETLNLNFNYIEGQIPKVIGSLINLRVLKLRGNKLIGFIPPSLSNASRLDTLDISFNSLQGNIPEGIGNLHNMNWLSIQYNQLTGSIPFTIFKISRIKVIAFTGNTLSGHLPNGLCNGIPIIKRLYLSYNKLHGRMPTSLSNCSQLQLLVLAFNELDGPIHSEIGRLSNLQILDLGTNHFTGTFHLMNTSTIESYYFRILFCYTLIAGIIPQENGDIVNLVKLAMEENQITGSVPISIFNISSLQLLSLWQNNLNIYRLVEISLSSEIPKEKRNLVELDELDLSFNSFSGSLDTEIFNISGLRIIDLSLNNLSGRLPPNIGSILPNIEGLFLGALTNLVGTIPHSISNCSKLTILELANNKLPGLIPNSLGYLTHLQILNLVANNLTSESLLSFLTSLTNCRNLTYLDISFNPLNDMLLASTGNLSPSLRTFFAMCCKIQGRIPDEVGNVSSLLDLRLSGNNLVGSIPATIGNLRKLQLFHLTNNKLTGFIGDHICKLQHLGNITSLREIHLGSNKLSSNTPPSLGNLQDLVVLDLSSNNMLYLTQ
ncbi:hypothetical protein P3S68_003418 [Capsicum galapagoense]